VLANHDFRPDDGQSIHDARHETIQPDEHQAIEIAESKSLSRLAPKNVELVPEDKYLRLKARPRAKQPNLVQFSTSPDTRWGTWLPPI
jgi:hypothetical protein